MIIAEVIERARRRMLWNEIASLGAHALSAVLGTLVLLLLMGTEILDWRWLIALPATALAAVTYLTLRHLPSSYSTAQVIDRRMKLADTLSTAVFFSTPGAAHRGKASTRQAQSRYAMSVSQNLNLKEAVPFVVPSAIYPAIVLSFIGAGMFALR